MGILEQIKNTTVADLDKVTGDFSDLAPATYRPRVPREMVRIVKGADDLKVDRPAPKNPGMVRTDGSGTIDTRPFKDDPRSQAQIDLMDSLIEQLGLLDHPTSMQAMNYTLGMTFHGKWTGGKDGNASRWIKHMILKVRELKAAPKVKVRNDDADFQDIPNGYYAVGDAGPDDIHYFRISRFRDGGIKVQEQASDTLHPVRRGGRRTAILKTIQNVGWRSAQELYGRTIGRCGRCHRTLTDADSRACGIGPDCRKKM